MQHIKTVFGAIHVSDLFQAHYQLEGDFLLKGWLSQRPSNYRRMSSTALQLQRMGIKQWTRKWVDIDAEPRKQDDPADEDVRILYIALLLQYGLPVCWTTKRTAERLIDPAWLHSVRPEIFAAPQQKLRV